MFESEKFNESELMKLYLLLVIDAFYSKYLKFLSIPKTSAYRVLLDDRMACWLEWEF